MNVQLPLHQKIYIASDFHLGTPNYTASIVREKRIVSWLDHIKSDAHSLYLAGDIFDFWFEYKHVIPKGFIRFQGKLAELRDAGISIHFFTGNHDMWMFNYFKTELGIIIHRKPQEITINEKKFLIGHGDGLGPGEKLYKIQKQFFNSKVCQWLFAHIHPNLGVGLAQLWSRKSRIANTTKEEKFIDEKKELLLSYCREIEKTNHHDFYIFGHRHLPLTLNVTQQSKYINLGEWVNFYTYAVFDGTEVYLHKYTS